MNALLRECGEHSAGESRQLNETSGLLSAEPCVTGHLIHCPTVLRTVFEAADEKVTVALLVTFLPLLMESVKRFHCFPLEHIRSFHWGILSTAICVPTFAI